jgi:hypothetical protein
MDPLTLFALANAAVSAVKAGCKLYKDIKGAAGDIKDVLKDLDDQFHKLYPSGATTAQRNAYITEKNRVIELNKKDGETANIYTEIGEHLGSLADSFKTLGRTENTKGLVVSAEAEVVYSALMTAGAEANITDIFHLGFKDVLSSMSVDEQHIFGQRILGKMKQFVIKEFQE